MKKKLTTPNVVATDKTKKIKFHGTPIRGFESVTFSSTTSGRFGRMFRNVPVFSHTPDNLAALAKSMISRPSKTDSEPVTSKNLTEDENPLIPAGYTYLGQFIDHDITFDPTSSLQRQNDPDALHNFRTPRFDLDSLYGRGPADQPYLYRNGLKPDSHPKFGFDRRSVMLLFQEKEDGDDLPRNQEGRALTGDPRNDENLIVSQLHLVFIKLHNRMVEKVFQDTGLTGEDLFEEAQRQVRWHYQWIVVHDFLPRIVDGYSGEGQLPTKSVVNDILFSDEFQAGDERIKLKKAKFRFYHWRSQPFLPVEFSGAAYRFGHSMVRSAYFINDLVKEQNNNIRIPLFSLDQNPFANLNGFRPLPKDWQIQWKYFYDIEKGFPAQRSFKIDTQLSNPLGNLPGVDFMASLAQRNLVRGLQLGIPSGQSVARAMGINPLTDKDLEIEKRGAPDFQGDCPLWFYILREAELLGHSTHLGPVGGRIVAEVLIGLLVGDSFSWINVEPNWIPPLAVNGKFGMKELLEFAIGNENSTSQKKPSPEKEVSEIDRWREKFGKNL